MYPFRLRVTVEVPGGWESCGVGPLEAGVCQNFETGISFVIVDNVVSDPCDRSQPQLVPPVGPSVDDLVMAISNLEGMEATDPVDVTVNGFHGKQLELSPETGFCPGGISTWATAEGTNGISPAEVNLLRILDVAGTRVLVAAAYQPTRTTADELAELRRVFESVRVAP